MNISNRIVPFIFLVAGLVIISSCVEDTTDQDKRDQEQRYFDIFVAANYPDAVPEASGLFYIENKEGTGAMPHDSSWVLMNHVSYVVPSDQVYETYIESVAIDNRIQDTSAMYGPFKTQNGTMNEGFTEGLNMMREGGEATFLFTSELGYGGNNTGDIPAYTSLKYEVILLEVLGDIEEYEAAKIVAYTDTIAGVGTVHDTINDVTMYYVVDSITDGPPVAIDSTIQVAYKGYLIDGRVFDESTDGAYFEFTVGDYTAEEGTAIDGWHLGLVNFNEGEKGRLIIPYLLAYGAYGKYTSKGNVAIPPYETLVFDVEVISVDPDDDDDEHPDEE